MFKLQYCTKCGQLILKKIIKIFTARCHILRPKCTKFDFGRGSASDPVGGAHSAPQAPSWIYGVLHLREGEGGEGKRGRGEKEGRGSVEEEGRGEDGRVGETCVMALGGGLDAPGLCGFCILHCTNCKPSIQLPRLYCRPAWLCIARRRKNIKKCDICKV